MAAKTAERKRRAMVKFMLVAAEREVTTIIKVIMIVGLKIDRVSWLLLCRRM